VYVFELLGKKEQMFLAGATPFILETVAWLYSQQL